MEILSHFEILTIPQFPDATRMLLHYEHAVLDIDGVLKPYGDDHVDPIIAEELQTLDGHLPHGISILSHGNHERVAGFPVSNPGRSLKTPGMVRAAVEFSGADLSRTIGIGDGLNDALIYKLAGIGSIAVMPSSGGHPVQELVRRAFYRPSIAAMSRWIDSA